LYFKLLLFTNCAKEFIYYNKQFKKNKKLNFEKIIFYKAFL